LIIIDEAGMADTLSLDTAVQFAIDHGASVRLIGDDQQLAAIGAGGVLRDIKNSHGALQLTELHRFTNPAEAAASLALREGRPEALDFYLDHGRVHVGDLAKITEDAFVAWVSDRVVGLDAIMLAPTRQLVADLNRRAREHRLGNVPVGQEVRLGDGNRASVGDVIITRTNDRRLRLTPTNWVKNGDRWTITRIGRRGDLTVRHSRSQLKCQLREVCLT
jgi:ATP-dependent exoDNAse (exonuclease V) alpha subunit